MFPYSLHSPQENEGNEDAELFQHMDEDDGEGHDSHVVDAATQEQLNKLKDNPQDIPKHSDSDVEMEDKEELDDDAEERGIKEVCYWESGNFQL